MIKPKRIELFKAEWLYDTPNMADNILDEVKILTMMSGQDHPSMLTMILLIGRSQVFQSVCCNIHWISEKSSIKLITTKKKSILEINNA